MKITTASAAALVVAGATSAGAAETVATAKFVISATGSSPRSVELTVGVDENRNITEILSARRSKTATFANLCIKIPRSDGSYLLVGCRSSGNGGALGTVTTATLTDTLPDTVAVAPLEN